SSRGALQKSQRLLVIRVRPDASIQSRDGLSVVIEHVRLSVENGVERGFVAVEVWNQHLDFAVGIRSADLANRFGPVGGAAVWEIVAVHGSDHRMREVQVIDSLCD